MERFSLDFSIPNFITIGLIGAVVYLIFVGGGSLIFNSGKSQAPAAS